MSKAVNIMLNNNDFNKLSFYTLSHSDTDYFIHQLIVDAFTAQTADNNTKKISIVFALVGLYLLNEKGFTGREIQQAHMRLAHYKEFLPDVTLPLTRGEITITDVLNAQSNRDKLIKQWCLSVWKSFKLDNMEKIQEYCDQYLYRK